MHHSYRPHKSIIAKLFFLARQVFADEQLVICLNIKDGKFEIDYWLCHLEWKRFCDAASSMSFWMRMFYYYIM